MTWTQLALQCLYALLILVAGQVVGSWLRDSAAMALDRTRVDPTVRRLLVALVRPVVLCIAVFAALTQLGIPMTTFAAVAGAVTLAVGLSIQGSMSNVASGAMLLSLRPFDVGDRITAGGHTGTVEALELFHTTLLNVDGDHVVLPNDVLWRGAIVNHTDLPTKRVSHTWTLAADTDLDTARMAILDVLQRDERILDTPAPAVVFAGTTEYGIQLTGRGQVALADKGAVTSDLQRDVLASFRAAGLHLATRVR